VIDRELAPPNREFQKKSPLQAPDETRRMTDRLGYAMRLRTLPDDACRSVRRRLGHKGPYMPMLLYACRENELSYEYVHGSVPYGAFTYSLAKTLRRETRRRKRAAPTFRELVDLVRDDMRDLGYDQKPAVTGPRAKIAAAISFPDGGRSS